MSLPTGKVREPPGLVLFVDLLPPWRPDDEVIEEFPFDDELMRKFLTDVQRCKIKLACCFVPFAPCMCVDYYLADINNAEFAYSRWVAVSKDNIYIIRKKRKAGWRCDCLDIPESRKTIPINNVQDVMISEPAAFAEGTCCCTGIGIPNVLTSVKIETAGGGHGGEDPRSDPSLGFLQGLADPQRFRIVILNLKKGVYLTPTGEERHLGAPPAIDSLGRTLGGAALPVTGTATPAAAGASFVAGGGGVEALLAEMLTSLKSIDKKLGYARIEPAVMSRDEV